VGEGGAEWLNKSDMWVAILLVGIKLRYKGWWMPEKWI
jgi:hypothetical protein